jgi:RNA polymerase sigma-70 factor (ECF subfamily)
MTTTAEAAVGTAPAIQLPESRRHDAAEESRLVAAAAGGDVRAFERLYRAHAPRVHGLCLRLTGNAATAEDCVQEAFVAAWKALPGFEARSRFGTWLHRIAVNAVLARRRGLAAQLETTVEDEAAALDRLGGHDAAPPLDVEQAIDGLPDGARHVLVLVGLYGYSHEEAATALGVAVGTCKAQLHRARQLLAARLDLAGGIA